MRLLRIGFRAGDELGLVLAGGYALVAHDLVRRPSRDIDFATATALPLPDVADRLAAAYLAAGFGCRVVEVTPRMARLLVSDPSADIAELRRWARRWEANIRTRLANGEPGPSGVPDDDWDAYLDRQ
ncbi:nucleotidyl transferase AbiEii/AbiGii toxin family protein [Micromonospora sp. NPDC018662]|uniref:nucleotidyl transferase AbiEii/AbiGii toxin family protein n=1 Tax=Micromonospora sp. NPDC018662 TaxID=3364238 RepID=UPI0037B60649